jgi:hypothetical protein
VETALSSLGDTSKQVIYWYIFNDTTGREGKAGVSQPEAFAKSVEKLLGPSAVRIEETVLEQLSSRLGQVVPEKLHWTFLQRLAFLQDSMGRPT